MLRLNFIDSKYKAKANSRLEIKDLKISCSPYMWWFMSTIPIPRRLQKEKFHKFKASLGYILSTKSAAYQGVILSQLLPSHPPSRPTRRTGKQKSFPPSTVARIMQRALSEDWVWTWQKFLPVLKYADLNLI